MPTAPETRRTWVYKPPRKETTAARGYGYDWRKLSARFRARWPHCVLCLLLGRSVAPTAAVCDHITPHAHNPQRRLDYRNLQTLCAKPHDNDKRKAEIGGSPVAQWARVLQSAAATCPLPPEVVRPLIPPHVWGLIDG